MTDIYYEKLIVKKKTTGDKISQWFTGIISVLVVFLIFIFTISLNSPFIPFAVPFAAAGVFYLAYKYIISFNVEYEIIITNEYFDLDKIINQKQRKRLISTKINHFNNFAKYDKTKLDKSGFQKKIYAYNRGDDNLYYVDLSVGGDGGKTLIVFSADDEMLKAIKANLPAHIARELSK
jgi:hypothetical protein